MSAVGGYEGLVDNYPYATASERARNHLNESCGEPPSDFMHLLRTLEPGKSNYPWIGMTLGLGILELWYWCMDQVSEARRTAIAKRWVICFSIVTYVTLMPGVMNRYLVL